MKQSDKKPDKRSPDSVALTRQPKRAERAGVARSAARAPSDDLNSDDNDVSQDADEIVSDRGADSDGDNDDEINNDVTSPNDPGAGNNRVPNDRKTPRPRG